MIGRLRAWLTGRRRGRLPDVIEIWTGDPGVRHWSACRVVWVWGGVRDCAGLGDPHPGDDGLRCYRVDCRRRGLGRWDVWAYYA